MIIFLNGSINSGKSTVAKLLADKLSQTAVVEVDHLRAFVHFLPLDKSLPINFENAVCVIMNLANRGFNVIVPYPIRQEDYEYLEDHLKKHKNDIRFFTLNPSFEKVLDGRERKLSDWEKERIKYHYQTGINSPTFGITLNTTNQTAIEVADEILAHLSS